MRVRLQRSKGWRKPADAVVVARPSPWGNPWPIGPELTRAQAVARYRDWIMGEPERIAQARAELAGRDLCCWCPLDGPCHADVLLELANPTPGDGGS